MRKSRSVRLVLLGGAGMALVACEEGPPQDARFFANAQDCAVAHAATDCQSAQAESERIHLAEAPKFSRKQECEAEFGAGNCETREAAGGGSFFMPLMMGYMLGNMLGGNRFNQPVYRGPNNSALMPRGGRLFNVGAFGGAAGVGTSAFRPAAQVTPVTRGGFGSTAVANRGTSGG